MDEKHLLSAIPADTYRNARKVYNIQHVYLKIGDQLDIIFTGIELRFLDPSSSIGLEQLVRLALVTAFQYAEALPDPAASQAVQQRMDWKYALYLPVNYPGIPASTLCSFRANLYSSKKGLQAYSYLLERLVEVGLIARDQQRAPEAHEVLTIICMLTRLYDLNQSMKAALGLLGSAAPDWLRSVARPHWYERYTRPAGPPDGALCVDEQCLKNEAARVGVDVEHLVEAAQSQLPVTVRDRAELRNLRQKFDEQFRGVEGGRQWQPPRCGMCSCSYSLDSHL